MVLVVLFIKIIKNATFQEMIFSEILILKIVLFVSKPILTICVFQMMTSLQKSEKQ